MVDKFDANSMLLSKPWWILGLELSHLHLLSLFLESLTVENVLSKQRILFLFATFVFLFLFVKENVCYS